MTLPFRYMSEIRSRRRTGGEGLDPVLIDVRSREEYIMEHIQGAINIPHHDLEYCRDLLRAHDITLYCNTGRRPTCC
ncbi:MAG: rhodanese-like domain-containing protein [Desulfobacterales bacterium]|nr:rhodanese-like domain-containing protein [Desulfobacterales bacterium]